MQLHFRGFGMILPNATQTSLGIKDIVYNMRAELTEQGLDGDEFSYAHLQGKDHKTKQPLADFLIYTDSHDALEALGKSGYLPYVYQESEPKPLYTMAVKSMEELQLLYPMALGFFNYLETAGLQQYQNRMIKLAEHFGSPTGEVLLEDDLTDEERRPGNRPIDFSN